MSSADDDDAAKLLADKDATIENLNIFIRKLQLQLDNPASSITSEVAASAPASDDMTDKVAALELELSEKSSMLGKRDTLIENLEEEVVELENQLKKAGKFVEKGPPMKGRKVVGDEGEDWVDPLQDVQGSLLFHAAMTLRLTVITIFYRIPKFLLSLPKRFMDS